MEHLDILHWFSKYSYVCIPVLAFLLDLIIGDPNSKYHPVAIIGRIISFLKQFFIRILTMIQKNYGTVVLLLV